MNQVSDWPADNLIRNPQLYNDPPVIPQLDIPRDYAEYIPLMSLCLANEVSNKANKNNIRCYCFNLLSENNFNNRDFVDLIQLAMGLFIVIAETGVTNDVNLAITESVTKACNIYSSRKAYENKNLHSYINKEQEEEILRNLNDAEMEMSKLNNILSSIGSRVMRNTGNQYINNNIRQPASNINFNNNSFTQPNIRTNNINSNSRFSFNVGVVNNQPVDNNRFSSVKNRPNSSIDRINNMSFINKDTSSNFIGSRDKGANNMPHKEVSAESNILQGNDMLKTGGTLTYFGMKLSLDDVISKPNIPLGSLSEPLSGGDTKDNAVYLSSMSLDDLFLTMRVKHIELLNNDPGVKIFTSYGFLTEPIINRTLVSKMIGMALGYSSDVKQITDLKDVGFKLKLLLKEISVSKETNADSDPTNFSETVKTVCNINNKLTQLINEFLIECLPDTAVIDSFIDDVEDLEKLMWNQPPNILTSWNNYKTILLNSISYTLTEGIYSDTIETIGIDSTKFDISLFTKIITITSINIDSIEFGCEIKDKTLIIDKQLTPNIWGIVDDIFKKKNDDKVWSIIDYVILADGTNFQIFKDSKNLVYKIKKIR